MNYTYLVRVKDRWFTTTTEEDTAGYNIKFRVGQSDPWPVEEWNQATSQWLTVPTFPVA
jgi:hypothetical protein